MRKLKVAVFSGEIPSTTFIENLIRGISQKGIEVYLFGKVNKPVTYKGNVRIFPTSRNKLIRTFQVLKGGIKLYLKDRKVFNRYREILEANSRGLREKIIRAAEDLPILNNPPDIFHIQWAKDLERRFEILKLVNCKVVVSFRGAHINYSPVVFQKYADAYRRYFPLCDAFHAVSEAIKKESLKYGADPGKIRVIYSGVDEKLLEIGRETYTPNEKPELISVGRIHWKKGYNIALDACRILKDKGIDFHYTIIARGDSESLVYQIGDLGLQEYVSIIPGLPHREVVDKVRNASLFILPSFEEGIANVALEAMALGCPVISTNCGGMEEAIRNNDNGWVVPVWSAEKMAGAIMNFTGLDQHSINGVILNARNTIKNQFLLERNIEEFYNFYNQLSSGRVNEN